MKIELVSRSVVEPDFDWDWEDHKVHKNYDETNVYECAIFVISSLIAIPGGGPSTSLSPT